VFSVQRLRRNRHGGDGHQLELALALLDVEDLRPPAAA
jgi:hypothetical protein